jgi:hypothetical protein
MISNVGGTSAGVVVVVAVAEVVVVAEMVVVVATVVDDIVALVLAAVGELSAGSLAPQPASSTTRTTVHHFDVMTSASHLTLTPE